jgi:hypothetical protein
MSKIDLLHADGTIESCEVWASTAPPWTVTVRSAGFDEQSFGADDLFNALIKWRREIDAQGSKLLCAGARRDVTPSGMSRSMGGARKAYVIKIGQPATIKVDIFDHADATEVVTVDEQKRFADQWFASLRAKLGA